MSEDFEDGNYLVRVRAQVMTRDDSTGGWVPMGGGGLSNVSVRRRPALPTPPPPQPISQETKHEYLIFGKRISDQSVVLSCIIKKDFEYNKVMPTFHHWKTGDKKFGLTFQTAADARAFDKGVRTAVEELIEGCHNQGPGPGSGWMLSGPAFVYNPLAERRLIYSSLSGIHGTPSCTKDVGDDDVFMTLNLPVERGDSRSSSDSSAGKPSSGGDAPVTCSPHCVVGGVEPESYSYVQLTAVHDYMYPVVEGEGSLKKHAQLSLPHKRKVRCQHCQETFSSDNNVRGSCTYAPDCVKTVIESVACVGLARRVLQTEPCDCDGSGCGRRWFALALLSLLVPCLWCYPPLRACHYCCVSCGLCGGKHQPTHGS